MESKVSFLASIFFSARRFISSLPLYFRSSHTDRFVAKFLKNFFRLPLGATRFGILHKSEPFCKFRNFLSVPCSLASFVRFLFRSLAARGRIISAFSALSIADFANHNPWGFLFLTHLIWANRLLRPAPHGCCRKHTTPETDDAPKWEKRFFERFKERNRAKSTPLPAPG